MKILNIILSVLLAFTLALLAGYWFQGDSQSAKQAALVTPKCTPVSETLANATLYQPDTRPSPSEDIEFHVSYNDLTNGHSKMVYKKGGVTFYVLQGVHDGHLVKCLVSEEFYASTRENSFVDVPASKCEEVNP